MHRASNFLYSHLNSAAGILGQYDGSIPFSHFIKTYFSQHKKFGSKDRKQITGLCYAFFRLGRAYPDVPIKERVLLALKNDPEPPDSRWQDIIEETNLPDDRPQNIFPWKNELSDGIDAAAFEASFAVQPDLFLRIRPGFGKTVVRKLEASEIEFEIDENAVRLPNAAKINDVLKLNKEAVVQDLSSQKITEFLLDVKNNFPAGNIISVYDCCAASGGKSILAYDVLKQIELTVSDIRPTIIHNLKKRFQEAGILKYEAFVQDISKSFQSEEQYDLVIADVPCTGSGTWSRTPEQLYFFDEVKIRQYAGLQKEILKNAIKTVKPGGYLLYITCSVFKQENGEQASTLTESGFEVVLKKIIPGYNVKADTMFGALLKKNG